MWGKDRAAGLNKGASVYYMRTQPIFRIHNVGKAIRTCFWMRVLLVVFQPLFGRRHVFALVTSELPS